jgi:hypothetical protein
LSLDLLVQFVDFRSFVDRGAFGKAQQIRLLEHPRDRVDGVGRRDLGRGRHFELSQSARADQRARLERPGRGIVGLHRSVQFFPHLVEVIREPSEALVELLAEGRHLAVVLGKRFLPPCVGDRREERNQRDRARQQHALLESMLDQVQVALECGAEQGLTREEHHRHLRRVAERLPVRFAAEAIHVLPDLACVPLQLLRARLLVWRFLRIEERFERRLGIHDNPLAAR